MTTDCSDFRETSNQDVPTASPEEGSAGIASACVDRRVARSKDALNRALVELMEERGFDSITVNDLCSRANLTRGTFYNHFRDKEDLLRALEDEVIEDLSRTQEAMRKMSMADLIKIGISKTPPRFLVEMFDYLRNHADFLHAALGSGGDPRLAPRLRDTVCEGLIKGALNAHYRENPTPFVEYYVAFYASAYMGVIVRWIETGMKESSEEMARISMRLLFIRPGEPIAL